MATIEVLMPKIEQFLANEDDNLVQMKLKDVNTTTQQAKLSLESCDVILTCLAPNNFVSNQVAARWKAARQVFVLYRI